MIRWTELELWRKAWSYQFSNLYLVEKEFQQGYSAFHHTNRDWGCKNFIWTRTFLNFSSTSVMETRVLIWESAADSFRSTVPQMILSQRAPFWRNQTVYSIRLAYLFDTLSSNFPKWRVTCLWSWPSDRTSNHFPTSTIEAEMHLRRPAAGQASECINWISRNFSSFKHSYCATLGLIYDKSSNGRVAWVCWCFQRCLWSLSPFAMQHGSTLPGPGHTSERIQTEEGLFDATSRKFHNAFI